jgi:regulatory protein
MVSRESKTSSLGSASGSPEPVGRGGRGGARQRRKPAPLDDQTLRDLALSYVARFATTAAKLEAYLARKLRERGVAEDGEGRAIDLDVPALVARLVELGYVDDDAWARGRSRDLAARGYGARRVEQALWSAGIAETARAEHAPGEAASRRAALTLAQKRGFGPFARQSMRAAADEGPEEQHKRREKQVAAMLRAGHLYEHVRFILEAAEPAQLEDWVREAEEEER